MHDDGVRYEGIRPGSTEVVIEMKVNRLDRERWLSLTDEVGRVVHHKVLRIPLDPEPGCDLADESWPTRIRGYVGRVGRNGSHR